MFDARLSLLAMLSLCGACVPRIPTSEAVDPSTSVSEPGGYIDQKDLMRDTEPFVAYVSQLRKLKQKERTPVLFQDDQAFEQMLRQSSDSSPHAPSAFQNINLMLALSTLSPLEVGEARGSSGDSGVAGFYDRGSRTIVMKRSAAFTEKENGEVVDDTSWTLAHETVHALQAQHFGLPIFKETTSEDQRLATRAVFEGDAMVGMLAYVTSQSWGDLRRTVINYERDAERKAEENYRLATGSGADFDKTPLIARERTLAPYREGLKFMGSVFRAGGFDALNSVYRSLPTTTEQILHIEKYLAGERGDTLTTQVSVDGHQEIASTRVGELLIRAALDQCLAKGEASKAAEGWGGDQLTLTQAKGNLSLFWVTSWDTERDAIEFENAAHQMMRCWGKRDREAKEHALFRGEHRVERKGQLVSIVYGIAEDELLSATTEQLLGARVDRPRGSKPVAGLNWTPVPQLPKSRPPYVAQGTYVNEGWGLSIPVPDGVSPHTEDELLLLEDNEKKYRIVAYLSDWRITKESNDKIFQNQLDDMPGLPKSNEDQELMGPLGPALRRTWRTTLRGTPVAMTVISPICNDMGSIVISAEFTSDAGHEIVRRVLAGTKAISKNQPACARLNP